MAKNTPLSGGKGSTTGKRGFSWRRAGFVGVVVGLIALYIWFTSRLDIDDVRSEIERELTEDAAYDVTVGDISWGWLSGFGINLQEVVVHTSDTQELLVSIDAVYLEVALVPLLTGAPQISLNKIEVDGVRTKFVALEEGGYLWEQEEGAGEKVLSLFEALVPVPRKRQRGTKQSRVLFNPDVAHLSDVVVDYTSLAGRFVLSFDDITLSGLQSEAKEAEAQFKGELKVDEQEGVEFDLQGRAFLPLRGVSAGRLDVDDKGVRRQILDLERGNTKQFEEELLGVTDFFVPLQVPWRLHVEEGEITLPNDTTYAPKVVVRWLNNAFEVNGELDGDMDVTLKNISVSEAFNELNWAGNLHIRADDMDSLRETMEAPPPQVLKSFSVEGDFNAVEGGMFSDNAAVVLNGEAFVGELLVVFDEQIKIKLTAQGSKLTLSPWLGYASSEGEEASTTSATRGSLAAVFSGEDPLWSEEQQAAAAAYRWEIELDVDRMAYAGLSMNQTKFLSQFDGQHVNVEISSNSTLGGAFDARVAVDMEPDPPVWQVRFDAERTNITELNQWLKLRLGISGVATVNGHATTVGRSKHELLDALTASARMRSANGWLDISAIKERALQFAGTAAEKSVVGEWPAQFQFADLRADLDVLAGYDKQRFEARVDGLVIEATGYVDPLRELMQMETSFSIKEDLFTSSHKARSGYFRDLKWPVDCRGRYTRSLPCRLLEGANNKLISELLEKKSRRLGSATNRRSGYQNNNTGNALSPAQQIENYLRQGSAPLEGNSYEPEPPAYDGFDSTPPADENIESGSQDAYPLDGDLLDSDPVEDIDNNSEAYDSEQLENGDDDSEQLEGGDYDDNNYDDDSYE